jgi:hypothetical protein
MVSYIKSHSIETMGIFRRNGQEVTRRQRKLCGEELQTSKFLTDVFKATNKGARDWPDIWQSSEGQEMGTKVQSQNLSRQKPVGRFRIHGRIILTCILKKEGVRMFN